MAHHRLSGLRQILFHYWVSDKQHSCRDATTRAFETHRRGNYIADTFREHRIQHSVLRHRIILLAISDVFGNRLWASIFRRRITAAVHHGLTCTTRKCSARRWRLANRWASRPARQALTIALSARHKKFAPSEQNERTFRPRKLFGNCISTVTDDLHWSRHPAASTSADRSAPGRPGKISASVPMSRPPWAPLTSAEHIPTAASITAFNPALSVIKLCLPPLCSLSNISHYKNTIFASIQAKKK